MGVLELNVWSRDCPRTHHFGRRSIPVHVTSDPNARPPVEVASSKLAESMVLFSFVKARLECEPHFFPVYSKNRSGYSFFNASILGRSHTNMYGLPGFLRA